MEPLDRRTWRAKVQKNASESVKIGRHGPFHRRRQKVKIAKTTTRSRGEHGESERSPLDGRTSKQSRRRARGYRTGSERTRTLWPCPCESAPTKRFPSESRDNRRAGGRARRRHDLTPGNARAADDDDAFSARARARSPRTAGQARRRRRRRAGFARARRRRSIAYGQQNGKRNRSAKTHIDTADYAAAAGMNEPSPPARPPDARHR